MRVTSPQKRGMFAAVVIGLLALVVSPAAQAGTLTFNLDFVFSGNSPGSTSPYGTALFRDGADCVGGACAAGTVQLSLTTSLEASAEFITEWDFNSSVLPLTITLTSQVGTFAAPAISTGSNAFQADGDGNYDIEFLFASAQADRFNGVGEVANFTITGAGITAQTFNQLSAPGGNAGGPFHTAAHVQGIQPNCSGWVSDTVAGSPGSGSGPCGAVPEPSSLLLLGSGLAGLGLFWGRKLMGR